MVGAWWCFRRDRHTHHLMTAYLQVVGACWYFLAVDRQVTCWKYNCQQETNILCTNAFFDCSSLDPGYTLAANRASWMNSSNITMNCDTISTPNPFFDFGIYVTAINKGITTSTIRFIDKYFYCAWIGLLSLRWVPCYLLVD